jgi:hypothetical protein
MARFKLKNDLSPTRYLLERVGDEEGQRVLNHPNYGEIIVTAGNYVRTTLDEQGNQVEQVGVAAPDVPLQYEEA